MRLYLAEKPSVAREIARALGCTRKEQGFFAGGSGRPAALVTWAIGHLVRFAEPGEMNPAWGKPWRKDALPMIPPLGSAKGGQLGADRPTASAWKLLPEPKTQEQFDIVARLMNDPRVDTIVNATDAGREGEAIFRRIYALAFSGVPPGSSKPVLRLWTSSLTEEALTEALNRLRPAAEYDALAAAALARAQLDWLIGMNHSRAATLHHGVTCSVGRVQTPTLAMIVRREREIKGFVKTYFYEVHAELACDRGDFIARALAPLAGDQKQPGFAFEHRADAEAVLAATPSGAAARVTLFERKRKFTPPPQLHNLGELQKEANRRFGLTADRTLAAAQSLYEAKAITYPRSSSRHLPEDMVGSLPAILRALRLGKDREPLRAAALARAAKGPKLSKRYIDGSKLSDHHAILPTAKPPGALAADEQQVYTIIAERFLAIWLPDKETEETRIDLEVNSKADVNGNTFRAQGSRVVAPGWTAISGGAQSASAEEAGEAQSLPLLRVGDVLAVLDSELVTRERKPPARFNDATLLSAMETAGREVDDEALREAMRGRGLGTEATRAAILQRLIDLEYVVREGKQLLPTGKGDALIASLEAAVPHLASPELTGDMEAKLAAVEARSLDPESLLRETAAMLRLDIPAVFRGRALEAPAAAPIVAGKDELRCPRCKAGLLERRGGPGAEKTFWGCSRFREGCGFALSTTVAQKPLTDAQVRQLCTGTHRTRVIRGFTSRAGSKFDAALWLNPANAWKLEFQFER